MATRLLESRGGQAFPLLRRRSAWRFSALQPLQKRKEHKRVKSARVPGPPHLQIPWTRASGEGLGGLNWIP